MNGWQAVLVVFVFVCTLHSSCVAFTTHSAGVRVHRRNLLFHPSQPLLFQPSSPHRSVVLPLPNRSLRCSTRCYAFSAASKRSSRIQGSSNAKSAASAINARDRKSTRLNSSH